MTRSLTVDKRSLHNKIRFIRDRFPANWCTSTVRPSDQSLALYNHNAKKDIKLRHCSDRVCIALVLFLVIRFISQEKMQTQDHRVGRLPLTHSRYTCVHKCCTCHLMSWLLAVTLAVSETCVAVPLPSSATASRSLRRKRKHTTSDHTPACTIVWWHTERKKGAMREGTTQVIPIDRGATVCIFVYINTYTEYVVFLCHQIKSAKRAGREDVRGRAG